MKARRHHNNKGRRQIQRGKTRAQLERIARRLKLPYSKGENAVGEDIIGDMKKRFDDQMNRAVWGEHATQASADTEASNLTFDKLLKTYQDFRAKFEFKLGEHTVNLLDYDEQRLTENTILLLRKKQGDERYKPLKPWDVIIIYIKERKALVYNPKPKPEIEIPPYEPQWPMNFLYHTMPMMRGVKPSEVKRDEFPQWLGTDNDFFEEFTEIEFR